MVYLDDILVTGTTFEDHLINVWLVLTRIREVGLRLKPTMCKFAQREVVYLGYVVSGAGISPDAEKVKAVQAFPTPLDLQALRSFLGLASYYRRFIPQFSAIASPLHALTKKAELFGVRPTSCLDEEEGGVILESGMRGGVLSIEAAPNGCPGLGLPEVRPGVPPGDRCFWCWPGCCLGTRAG